MLEQNKRSVTRLKEISTKPVKGKSFRKGLPLKPQSVNKRFKLLWNRKKIPKKSQHSRSNQEELLYK